jgi:hypothetical protein
MLYLLIGEDAAASHDGRRAAGGAHRARLEQLQREGRLVLAGSMPAIDAEEAGPAGYLGSLVVAEFRSLEEAEAWLAAEPYVGEGVFSRTLVRPFLQDFPR